MTILTKQQKPLSTMDLYEDIILEIYDKNNIIFEQKSQMLRYRANVLKYMLYDNVVAMPLNTIAKKQGENAEIYDISYRHIHNK